MKPSNELVTLFRSFLAEVIRWSLSPPAQPGPFALEVVGETDMPRANVTVIGLPALPADNPDKVVRRDFTISQTGGVSVFNQAYAPGEEVPVTVNLVQGIEVELKLVDKDAAGNASVPSTYVFTPTDVTPPQQPGPFQIQVTGEVEV